MMRSSDPLAALGWNDAWESTFSGYAAEGYEAARVILEHQHIYRVSTGEDEPYASVSGRFRHGAASRLDYPAVGDWVAVGHRVASKRLVIHAVLPRRSRFVRKVAGSETDAQVVAANVDLLFLVSGLDDEYNLRRIERYLVTALEGGATPIIVLNKSDVCREVATRVEAVKRLAPGVPVHAVSCRSGDGLAGLHEYLGPGVTIALLGSSGVGKSTIVNTLLGFARQRTREVRAQDGRGRHTTTHRELVALPGGTLLIDTPGMRELQLWSAAEGVDDAFDDIRQAAEGCHFRDCRHDTEPRCAVKAAVEAGTIPRERLRNYLQLHRELAHLAERRDERLQLETKRKLRIIHRVQRIYKPKG